LKIHHKAWPKKRERRERREWNPTRGRRDEVKRAHRRRAYGVWWGEQHSQCDGRAGVEQGRWGAVAPWR
jgi:hypothetical protein